MKYQKKIRLFNKLALGLLLTILPFANLLCQNISNNSTAKIITERSFYVTGEQIGIKVLLAEFRDNKSQNILYVDLIQQDGEILTSTKLRIINGIIASKILIPEYAKSGYYIIRAYTREMQSNPSLYAFAELKIINIVESETIGFANKYTSVLNENKAVKSDAINVEGLLSKYTRRHKVNVSILLDSTKINIKSTSISIIPKKTYFANSLILASQDSIIPNVTPNFNEKRGFVLSGSLTSKDSNLNVSGKRIFSSVLGTKDINTAITDSLGKFYFIMPDIIGEHEVYVSTDTVDNNSVLLINKDMDLRSDYRLDKRFSISNKEKKLALKLSQNLAIKNQFYNHKTTDNTLNSKYAFYYKADETIVIDEYIDMPKLHMYFSELPSSVRYNPYKKRDRLRIISQGEIKLFLNPLILIDDVVVNDIEAVLKINPKRIDRIEVVNQYYQKGELSFGGIINFISKENDFGGFEFRNSSLVINYMFLNETYKAESFIPKDNLPDSRTTLYWNPSPEIKSGKITIDFTTSDVLMDYLILVQAVDNEGNIVYFTKEFKVK